MTDSKAKINKLRYVQIPLEMLADKKIKSTTIKVYGALSKFADNKTGFCYPSNEQITELTGISPRHVRTATKQLCELGWIEKTIVKSRHKANEFCVLKSKTGSKKVQEKAVFRGDKLRPQREVLEGTVSVPDRFSPPNCNHPTQEEYYPTQEEETYFLATISKIPS